MAKKAIDQFTGPLTPQQVADGMNAARRNAMRLYEDAELLANAGRFPSATALAILSIEEAGKHAVLRQLSTAKDDAERKGAWRNYRSHQAKNAAWIIVDLAVAGARKLDDLKPIFDSESDHPAVLDAVKQIALYTDCYGKAHWSEPDNVVDESLCRSIMTAAKVLLPKAEITVREIELWVEHMENGGGKEALSSFFRSLREAGLDEHTEEVIERFLGFDPLH